MRRNALLLILLTLFISLRVKGQSTPASFTVGGDLDKYYPVLFKDICWDENRPTVLEIGRSSVHEDNGWRGSLMLKITYHLTCWGHGSNFINVETKSLTNLFIAGWKDITGASSDQAVLIWLRGGGTTYHYISNSASMPAPVIYDGTDGRTAYIEAHGPAHSYKTTPDAYVNPKGLTYENDISIQGNLGIGTVAQGAKLAVKGKIIASEIEVKDVSNIPDYVFAKDYQLKPLEQVKSFVGQNHHLPEVPSEKEFKEKGMNMAEMNALLLKKIEELTLYMIEQNDQIKAQQKRIETLENTKTYFKHK